MDRMEKGLTIAYDAKRAFLNYRGLGNYCRNLFRQLSVYYPYNRYLLLTPKDNDTYPWLHSAPMTTITPQGMWKLSPSLWRQYGIPHSIQNEKVDIYHGLSQELPHGIEKADCRKIVTMHDAIFLRYPELYSRTYVDVFTRKNIRACQTADLIIAISEQTKRDYIEFFGVDPARIRVVYQGCYEGFWQQPTAEQMQAVGGRWNLPEHYILSVGALEARKNAITIIDAIASAKIAMPLVLVGRGKEDYKRILRERAKALGVTLMLIEDATMEDLPAIYRMSEVFVYPSLFEGFGIPVLEAARSEVPIVASTGTCFEEIAAEGALYADPHDAAAIGQQIARFVEDKTFKREQVETALRHTEHFRDEAIARSMWKVYQELI